MSNKLVFGSQKDEDEPPSASTIFALLEIIKEKTYNEEYAKAREYLEQASSIVEKMRKEYSLKDPTVAHVYEEVQLFKEALQKIEGGRK